MKIRNGFVSNSSSSSFVIAGILLDDTLLTNEKKKEMIIKATGDGAYITDVTDEDDDRLDDDFADYVSGGNGKITVFQGGDDGITDGKFMIGKVLFTISDEGDQLYMHEIDFDSLDKIAKDIKELSGFEGEMKIIATTRSC